MGLLMAMAQALRRFRRAENGVAAVEFALIAPIFIWVMIGLGELTLIGLAQTSLDFALSDMARQIRTGEVQSRVDADGAPDPMTEDQFKSAVCDRMGPFVAIDCGNMALDVKSYTSFEDVEIAPPIDPATGQLRTNLNWDPGATSSIVVVSAFYKWSIITPYFQDLLGNLGNQRLLASTILLRNEPF